MTTNKDAIKQVAKDVLAEDGPVAAASYLARILFLGIKERNGNPYFGHCERVALGIADNRVKPIGYLHDVVEDVDGWEFEDLEDIGFDDYIIAGVRAVTKRDGAPYFDEMVMVGKLPQARAVKRSDLSDNMDVRRLNAIPTDSDIERLRKYYLSYRYLTDIEEGRTAPGTLFVEWMKTRPAGMQDWALASKYSTEKIPASSALAAKFQP